MIKFEPLQFYVDKLKRSEHFSLARYGDGELYCMWGAKGRNSNKCDYTPELRQALLDSMKHKDDPTFIYGLQRVLPQDEKRMTSEYPDVGWHDSEFLSEAVANGELYPLIEQLKKMKTITIYKRDPKDIIGNINSVITPPYNTYAIKDDIIKFVLENKADVYLFSCGMAANAIIAELHGKVDAWLLDVGHIWDGFFGEMSRCDLEGKTLEDINKNLYAPTDK